MEQELLAAEQSPDQLTAAKLPPLYTDQDGQQPRDQCPQSLHHICSQETCQPVYYKSVPLMVHIEHQLLVTVSKNQLRYRSTIPPNSSGWMLWHRCDDGGGIHHNIHIRYNSLGAQDRKLRSRRWLLVRHCREYIHT